MPGAKPWSNSCPMSPEDVIDTYFLEHRAKLLDVAAFLDRVERATSDGTLPSDFRLDALKEAIGVLHDGKNRRAERVLDVLSDPTTDPIPAAGMKGATGAYDGGGA